MLGRDVLALRQLEHVFDAVHHLERPRGCQLAHVPRVEEAVTVCAASQPALSCRALYPLDLLTLPKSTAGAQSASCQLVLGSSLQQGHTSKGLRRKPRRE